MRLRVILVLFSIVLLGFVVHPVSDERDRPGGLLRLNEDTDRNYTTVGSIGLTVTNFGTIGTRNSYWPSQPSCEYPRGSRIEHIYQGGLWVGAVPRSSGQQLVTTGTSDRSFTTSREGYEFKSEPDSTVMQRSSLSESQYFDPNAISHQDFLATYSDHPSTNDTIPEHIPLNISVRQESYAWNFPFADFFVILNYTIYNTGLDTLDSVYVGLWDESVVRNTNNVRPGTGSSYFTRHGDSYFDSLRMGYTFDYDGLPIPPAADSYVGIKLLGTTPFPIGVTNLDSLKNRTYYNAWTFQQSAGFVALFSPDGDANSTNGGRSRFGRLSGFMDTSGQINLNYLRTNPGDYTTLLSAGPFRSLLPGDSVTAVFGVVCARKFGTAPARNDTREQRKTLYLNAGFAQQAYDGEDVNGNDSLDTGEDLNGNGKLDHFQLPQPPRSPKVRAVVEDRNVFIYWDKATSETSLDPITRQYDFEGYRVYRSNAGADFGSPENLLLTLSLVGEFDVPGNTIGYNTGFSAILLDSAKYFPDDTTSYWYRFPPRGANVPHLNGWQYLYGVAAFDRGDSATGITSLQSKTEIRRVVPGTAPTSDPGKKIGVYPNPYYVSAAWDGEGERNRKIYFYNLPQQCQIRVYTLAGDIVADMHHDAATYDGTEIDWFQRFGGVGVPAQFSGGEHAWNLITRFDQAIATGLYLFSVKDAKTGDIKTGKFLVIK